jgi:hypothetical protein
MSIVTELTWDEVASPDFGPTQDAWNAAIRTAAEQIAAQACEKIPDAKGRIERALALVLDGAVQLHDDGSATVEGTGTRPYTVAEGVCDCKDYPRAPHNCCKHRLGAAILRRALELTQPTPARTDPAPGPEPGQSLHLPALLPESLLPYIVHIKGKAFVQYGGLLTLAQSRGLISLKVDFISVTPELALARAEAIFADGRVYGECADATPGNVGAQVRPHFPRLALTRAKARTLRDALGITMVALEELGDD